MGAAFSVKSVELEALSEDVSPVVVLDNFRVNGHPFGPHPHAGFSPITYVLEDSPGSLRSRDSLGHDITMGPGGIVWTEAGHGMLHEELPAKRGKELHGLQIFINLSAFNKGVSPRVLTLDSKNVPEWKDSGERVRVVVGSFNGVSSPLVPAEPFTLLDVWLKREVNFRLKKGNNALVYVLDGEVQLSDGSKQTLLQSDQAIALSHVTKDSEILLESRESAHLIILSGKALNEPVVVGGGFILSSEQDISAATQRFESGRMGHLDPARDY